MIQVTPLAEPLATLEIGDHRLPARMVVGRLRADLPRIGSKPALSRRLRARLVMTTLVALLVPLASATRHRQAA
jgi:hypothetical protein